MKLLKRIIQVFLLDLPLHEIRTLLQSVDSPESVKSRLAELLCLEHTQLWVKGPVGNRVLLIDSVPDFQLITSRPITETDPFITHFSRQISSIRQAGTHLAYLTIRDRSQFFYELGRPLVKLVSLFHRSVFPLPRFALGISDIAGSVRRNFTGEISLSDMQLDESLPSIIKDIRVRRYDIIGISATFGQQDLLEELLHAIQQISSYQPLIIVGGSLAPLNHKHLLALFPELIIAMGYGETTMSDCINYWHGFIEKTGINHIAYAGEDGIHTTPKHRDDKSSYATPELDLLNMTLQLNGVMQLESSRGCTYRCSFCPREHKGQWSPDTGGNLENILPLIKDVFAKHPGISRKIFLVDEEFIGYNNVDTDTEARALIIARTLQQQGFRFESSTRIDQVIRPRQSTAWHIQRIGFWKQLKNAGMSRMLFGMESGVDSILKRFNKQTTADQNIQAVRLLTMLGIPLRLTYITFDPLMNMDELIQSFYFLGRKDCLMEQQEDTANEVLFEQLHDPGFIRTASLQVPLYSEISYMLVSMESLIGSSYLKMVEEADLAREYSFSMGRRHAVYKNRDIGLMSELSQRWIDRNFALDYTLKSMIKISDNETASLIKEFRRLIKASSYTLLAKMLAVINQSAIYLDYAGVSSAATLHLLSAQYASASQVECKKELLFRLLDEHIEQLSTELSEGFLSVRKGLPGNQASLIHNELENWLRRNNWELINA